jgi:Domain of unknown function (DUF4115)
VLPETTTERLVALVGLAAAIALLVLAFSQQTERGAVHVAAPTQEDGVSAQTATRAEEPVVNFAHRPSTRTPVAADQAILVVRAARGDCWLSIHANGATGKLLYEGVLASGRSVRVQGARLWLRLGAASNLDLVLNGKPVAALAAGTFDVVATARGVEPAT